MSDEVVAKPCDGAGSQPLGSEYDLIGFDFVATTPLVALAAQEMWKPKEVAELLNVKSRAIYAWVLAGKLEAIKTPGGHLRIPAAEVKRLLRHGVEESSNTPLTEDEG